MRWIERFEYTKIRVCKINICAFSFKVPTHIAFCCHPVYKYVAHSIYALLPCAPIVSQQASSSSWWSRACLPRGAPEGERAQRAHTNLVLARLRKHHCDGTKSCAACALGGRPKGEHEPTYYIYIYIQATNNAAKHPFSRVARATA